MLLQIIRLEMCHCANFWLPLGPQVGVGGEIFLRFPPPYSIRGYSNQEGGVAKDLY